MYVYICVVLLVSAIEHRGFASVDGREKLSYTTNDQTFCGRLAYMNYVGIVRISDTGVL